MQNSKLHFSQVRFFRRVRAALIYDVVCIHTHKRTSDAWIFGTLPCVLRASGHILHHSALSTQEHPAKESADMMVAMSVWKQGRQGLSAPTCKLPVTTLSIRGIGSRGFTQRRSKGDGKKSLRKCHDRLLPFPSTPFCERPSLQSPSSSPSAWRSKGGAGQGGEGPQERKTQRACKECSVIAFSVPSLPPSVPLCKTFADSRNSTVNAGSI